MTPAAIAIVAPEPVSWLEATVAAAERAGQVYLFAPWAMHPMLARVAGSAPGPVAAFARRRRLPALDGPADRVVSIPGWILGEAGLRVWVRGRADRALEARFWLRRTVDIQVARWLRGMHQAPRLVIAPSLAARRTLSEAASRSAIGFLLEDIPGIRGLHRDLDSAARSHPRCRFLRRYRASDRTVVRQEVERALAEYVIVRGAYARDERRNAGMAEDRIVPLPVRETMPASARSSAVPVRRTHPLRVLLAGLAAARHGTMEALAALASQPDIELYVRAGEGLEPPELLQHPRVRPARRAHVEALEDIDLVIAPSWCETYANEVTLAGALGVPVVATRRGAGFIEPAYVVEPGDSAALARAIGQARVAMHAGAQPARQGSNHQAGLEDALLCALGQAL